MTDINDDKFVDVVAVGNDYQQEPLFGRYDASFGTILLGDGKATWRTPTNQVTGFTVDGDAREIQLIHGESSTSLVVFFNNAESKTYRIMKPSQNHIAKKQGSTR